MIHNGNIMAAAAVDREFWCIYASFELTLKCPGMLWGLHCASFVSLWGTFGISLGHLGQSWGALWAAWGCIGASWGCFGDALGLFWASLEEQCPREHPSQADGSQVPRLRTKTSLLEFARRSRRSRPDPVKRSTNYSSDPPFHTRQGSG